MMFKISFEITGINYILKYKTVILNSTNIKNVTVFAVFWIK